MKGKLIVFGLMLVLLIYFMGRSAFAAPEPAITLFLVTIAMVVFLLSLFVYRMKNDMAKMQQTMDELAAELKRTREVKEAEKESLKSEQEAAREGVKKTLWDELGQAEKDEHIAKIQKSMKYTGSTSSSEERMRDIHDIVPIGA